MNDEMCEIGYPGPQERLEQIVSADNDGILDIIHEIFEDGYQEGFSDGALALQAIEDWGYSDE